MSSQDREAALDTFPRLLLNHARVRADRPAMREKDLGIWQTWTWAQVLEIVRAYAVGLQRLGLEQGDTIAIVGSRNASAAGVKFADLSKISGASPKW